MMIYKVKCLRLTNFTELGSCADTIIFKAGSRDCSEQSRLREELDLILFQIFLLHIIQYNELILLTCSHFYHWIEEMGVVRLWSTSQPRIVVMMHDSN